MRRWIAIATLVIVSACGDQYQYVQRNGEPIRIDKRSGRMAVMRRAPDGTVTWMELKNSADVAREKKIAAAEAAAQATRCRRGELPKSETDRITVSPGYPTTSGGVRYEVANQSAWVVDEIQGQSSAGQVVLRKATIGVAPRLDPGEKAAFELAHGVEPGVGGSIVYVHAYGVPSGCPLG